MNSTPLPSVTLGDSAGECGQLVTESRQSSEFTSVHRSSWAHAISDPKWPLIGWCFTPALAPNCCWLFSNLRTTLKVWKCASRENIREKVLQVQEATERKRNCKNTLSNDISEGRITVAIVVIHSFMQWILMCYKLLLECASHWTKLININMCVCFLISRSIPQGTKIINDKAKIWTQVELQHTCSNLPTILPTRLPLGSKDRPNTSQAFADQILCASFLSLSCSPMVSECSHQEENENTDLRKDIRAVKRKRSHEKEVLEAFHYWRLKLEF